MTGHAPLQHGTPAAARRCRAVRGYRCAACAAAARGAKSALRVSNGQRPLVSLPTLAAVLASPQLGAAMLAEELGPEVRTAINEWRPTSDVAIEFERLCWGGVNSGAALILARYVANMGRQEVG